MSDCPLLASQHTAITTQVTQVTCLLPSCFQTENFHCDTNAKIKPEGDCFDKFQNISIAVQDEHHLISGVPFKLT